ncbi:sigma 1 component protein p22, partial [Melampsora americana]
YPKICHHKTNVQLILIGTELDLRNKFQNFQKRREHRMVSILHHQAAAMACDMSAVW